MKSQEMRKTFETESGDRNVWEMNNWEKQWTEGYYI
jgi:hypothetical protein